MNPHDPNRLDANDAHAPPDAPAAEKAAVGSSPSAPQPALPEPESPSDLICKSLGVLVGAGDVVEVRILKTSKGTVSGYYNELDTLARDRSEERRVGKECRL